jgi:hypothetical protein
MSKTMKGIEGLILSKPDEVRTFDKGKVEIFNLPEGVVGRATFEPGWRWSDCLKPVAKTDSCESEHVGYQVSGTMHILLDDGQEYDIDAEDIFYLPAGHDAWVLGDEPVVTLDFNGMKDYAKVGKEGSSRRAQRKH